MKKIRTIFPLLMALVIFAGIVYADPHWQSPQTESATDNSIEIRWGDSDDDDDGDWEMGMRGHQGGFHPVSQGHYTWPNGEKVPFVFTFTPSTGIVAFNLDSNDVTHKYEMYENLGLDELHIVAKTSNNGNNESWACEINDLVVNGETFDAPLLANTSNGNGAQWLTGTFSGLCEEPGEIITVEGTITFSWSGSDPYGSHMEIFFYLGPPCNPYNPDSITVVTPNGGETLIADEEYFITWTSDDVRKLRILLSTDGGQTWDRIKNNIKASEPGYEWEVPDIQSSQCLIRIENKHDSSIFDVSDSFFTISVPPEIELETPEGEEIWTAGQQVLLEWESEGLQTVALEYTTDGQSWTMIDPAAPASNEAYLWTVPNADSDNCYIRVSGGGESDTNEDPFIILPAPSITLTSPNGGEEWRAGSVQTITWTSQNVLALTLEYSTNGVDWSTIELMVGASSGTYSWTVPDTPSETCIIRAISLIDPSINDTSDAAFTIAPVPSITLTSPNGGEEWLAGSEQAITWTAVNVGTVTIEYFADNASGVIITTDADATAGSFAWTVPDAATENGMIKIIDTSDDNIFDSSDAAFTILPAPSLALTYPNGGESLIEASPIDITWTQTNAGTLTIEFTNNGTDWIEIATGVNAADETYAWVINAVESPNCRIRLTSETHSGVSDESDGDFAVLPTPSITVTSPNGGEVWLAGSEQAITWTSTTVALVTIEFNTDGTNWTSIAESVPAAAGTFAWTVPEDASAAAFVRISSADNAQISDISDNPFTIEQPSAITVTAPNGGEVWTAGSEQVITWTAENVTSVLIEYSTDGSSWSEIATGVAATDGSYTWTVPDSPSQFAFVRITDTDNAETTDVSDNSFTVRAAPAITVTAPNGGENITSGGEQQITWTSASIAEVLIEFSADGENWTTIAENVDASLGTYPWTVPSLESTACLVRISDTAGTGITDTSDAPFSITFAPTVTVTAPNGGENWIAGTEQAITWTSTNVGTVTLAYTVDGSNWTTVAETVDAATGSFAWTIPATPSSLCTVRVTSDDNTALFDTGDATFTILPAPSITVTTPNGGENWTVGSSQTITWTAETVDTVSIEYSTDGTNWTEIAASVNAAPGSFAWTVPDVDSATCTVRISDTAGSGVSDISDNTFTITPAPTVTVVSPNGGERWTAGSEQAITWTATNVGTLTLEYTTDNTNWTEIAASVDAATSSFAWTVPETESETYLVRLTGEDAPQATDTSDAPFAVTLAPSVAVTAPNGGESWTAGSSQTITWTATNITSLSIEYTVDGTSWTSVAAGIDASTGSYAWTVPAIASETVSIRLTDESGSGATDTSDAPFTIAPAPAITVTSPNGGENWFSGSSQTITWTSINVGSVNIEYSTDGTNWTSIAANISAVTASHTWTVPELSSETVTVRITDASNPSVSDTSDVPFTIAPAPELALTSPVGGESWTAGSTQRVTWTAANLGMLKIEYSTDGTNWAMVAENIPAANGAYNWVLPQTPAETTHLRLVDQTNPAFMATHATPFAILPVPAVTLTAPNGGESWVAGSQNAIRWTSTNIDLLSIQLSINGGSSWTTLVENVSAASGSWTWAVPNAPSSSNLIRIYKSTDPAISDASDAAFTIQPEPPQPTLVLNSPNGGESWTAGTAQTITWSSNNIASVGLEYTINGSSWISIAANIPASAGSYDWTVQNTPSGYCFVRVYDMNKLSTNDTSDAQFSITPQPFLMLIAPNGGEQIRGRRPYTIRWTSTNVYQVNLLYKIDDGPWTIINENLPASNNAYEWIAPDAPSQSCLVRIDDVDTTVSDQSNGFFTILPAPEARIVNIDTGLGYDELAPAVAEVQPGETLEFRKSGSYTAVNINIDKAGVTLQTADGIEPVLRSYYQNTCLKITASDVTLQGFTVSDANKHGIWITADNATVTDIKSRNYVANNGVFAENADYLTVTNLSIQDVGLAGLNVKDSNHVTINSVATPTFSSCKNGVLIDGCTDVSMTNLNIGTDWQDNVRILNSSDVTLTDSSFRKARNGIYVKNSENIVIERCDTERIWNNSIHFDNVTTGSVTGGSINSSAINVDIKDSDDITVSDINAGESLQSGTGVYSLNTTGLRVTGSTIQNAWSNAVTLINSPSAYIDHNILTNTKYGVQVGQNSDGTVIINNTIIDNNSSGIYVNGAISNVNIRNNIIVANGWNYWTWGIQCQNDNHPGLSITYNNIWNNRSAYKNCSPGIGEISADPIFVANFGDVHLQSGSPSIDAGDPNDPYDMEPEDNGDRINQGAYGGTGDATATSAQILSVIDAASNGWISLYCYPWDGMQYSSINALTNETVDPWTGFWVIVHRNMDILFPPDINQGGAETEMSIVVEPDDYYLISTPLQPENTDINIVFGDDLGDGLHDGSEFQFWRTSKYNYLTETYDRYSGAGSIPEILSGRGFWVHHIYPIPMYLTVTGTPVPQDRYREFKLPAPESTGDGFHMVGNPFHYPYHWGSTMIRVPMTDENPLGKAAALTLPDDIGELDLWHINLSLSDPTGTFYDLDNRAGVVESGADVSTALSSIDLAPFTPDYLRLVLNSPDSIDDTKYNIRYHGPMKNEYQWEIDMSTSFGAIDANLDIEGVEEIPNHYIVSLVYPDGTSVELIEDTTVPVRLSNFGNEPYTLSVRRRDYVPVDDESPEQFAITGTFPNPFNPTTTIEYSTHKDGVVRARLYNLSGQLVETITNSFMPAGHHSFVWNAKGHASGVYILLLESNGLRETAKITLLK